MNDIIELVTIILTLVIGLTLIYKLLPFKVWKNQKPKFVFFPKYIVNFNGPVSEIESALERIEFNKNSDNTYSRGKIYGDFSAKATKFTVEINEEKKQIKIYSPFFGIVFDTGDTWKITSEIIKR